MAKVVLVLCLILRVFDDLVLLFAVERAEGKRGCHCVIFLVLPGHVTEQGKPSKGTKQAVPLHGREKKEGRAPCRETWQETWVNSAITFVLRQATLWLEVPVFGREFVVNLFFISM